MAVLDYSNRIADKIVRTRAFWNREETDRPLISLRIGTDLPYHQFRCAKRLQNRHRLAPEDFVPEEFLEDYARLAAEIDQVDHDTFFGLDPFMGVPWMEAILGCPVGSSDNSGWSHEPECGPQEWLKIPIDLKTNAWFQKLCEFARVLADFSRGRYPVAQPLFRGPSDLINAVMGHENAVIGFIETPDLCRQIIERCTRIFTEVMEEYNKLLPRVHEGWIIGLYNIWTPEKCCRFQEDATALYSPNIYRKFVRCCDEAIAGRWKYNMIHTHPHSFFVLDELLQVEPINCVQVSLDSPKQAIELIPQLQKIQNAGKCLLVEGWIPWDTLVELTKVLENKGLFYQTKAETVEKAQEFMEKFKSYFRP